MKKIVHHIFILSLLSTTCFVLLYTFSTKSFAQVLEINKFFDKKWNLNKESIKEILDGKVLVDAIVDSENKKQSFILKAAALHPKKCSKALRKLSLFENYDEWISFIKSSIYDEKYRLLTLKANHTLLPYPMLVHIIVDRPTKPGIYPFTFPTGIFTGLKGQFEIQSFGKRCIFYAHSNWQGKDTGIPDFVVELFAETLSRIGGEVIIRKTKF